MNEDRKSSSTQAIWDRVQSLLDSGRLDEALEEATKWRRDAPDCAEASCLLGIVRSQRGELDDALSCLDDALTLDPGLEMALLEKARVLFDQERFEDVLELLDDEYGVEALFLAASALYELGELEVAESTCREALAVEDLPEIRQLHSSILLQRGDREGALAQARSAIELDPDGADGHHSLGRVLTQLGRLEEADAAFARAAELDPESYFRPFRVRTVEFDAVVDEALSTLPEEFQRYLENVEVAIEDLPDPELIRDGTEFDLLGLYYGGTIQSESWGLPDRILLFQRNLENVSPDREALIEEIRATVHHEIGHHMGMDEDAVRRAEEDSD